MALNRPSAGQADTVSVVDRISDTLSHKGRCAHTPQHIHIYIYRNPAALLASNVFGMRIPKARNLTGKQIGMNQYTRRQDLVKVTYRIRTSAFKGSHHANEATSFESKLLIFSGVP